MYMNVKQKRKQNNDAIAQLADRIVRIEDGRIVG